MSDGKSWLNLGNAYMATFFTSAFDQGDLHRALRAYSRADACGAGADPDLHFNKASVHRYLEEYPQAVAELQYAGELDPTLPVASALRDMRQLVREMAKMVSSRCSLSPARLRTVLDKALPPDRDPSLDALAGRGPAPLASLREGANTALAVTCLVMATPKTDVPIRFVVSDRDGTFAAVSVFNMLEGKARPAPLAPRFASRGSRPSWRLSAARREGRGVSD
jgi:tetratricopeptide (TPR) repeat protein